MKQQPFTAYTVRSNSETEIWTRLGAAFPNKKGGFTVLLDAMPAPNKGQYRIIVVPPKLAEPAAEAADAEGEADE
jgi:hypothetical protein